MYVSVQIFVCDVTSNDSKNIKMMGEVTKHEYTCFAKYVEEFQSLPEFNNKNSQKFSRIKDQK